MSQAVQTEVAERILSVRMQRPEKKNAITLAMYSTMADALERLDEDPALRVLFLTGTADCFTSGNDIADFLNSRWDGKDGEYPVARFLHRLVNAQKPIVAAINGPVVGVGVTMLLHCDLVYAAETARLQLPFASLGLCPEAVSSFLLPSMLGHSRAAELLMLGEPFTAARACELGIVNTVFPAADYQALAYAKAKQLALQPPHALRTTKRLMRRAHHDKINETLQHEFATFAALLGGAEAREAMQAFVQKRAPDFSTFS